MQLGRQSGSGARAQQQLSRWGSQDLRDRTLHFFYLWRHSSYLTAPILGSLRQIRQKWRLWIPVFAGCGLLLAIIFAVREHNPAINPPSVVTGTQNIRNNLYTFLMYFAFPLPLAACWLANRLRARRLRIVLILFALAVVPCLFRGNLTLILFFVVIGFGALADLFLEAAKSLDRIGLFLMLWILIPLPIVYYLISR